ncbi:MAG: hypothetical protein Q9214_002544 [Letrouitia sp. 1 TL-2023]
MPEFWQVSSPSNHTLWYHGSHADMMQMAQRGQNKRDQMAPPAKIPEAEWQKHEATIRHLYIDENLTLDLLVQEMSSSHGFLATKSQYTAKFKAWKLQKNSNSELWKGVGGALKRRHCEVSEAEVYFNGDRIPIKKLKKELQRYTIQADAFVPATPEGITIQLEEIQTIQRSIPRSFTISLPWHDLVERWSQVTYSPALSPATRPTALPTQFNSPGWTSLHSQSKDNNKFGQETSTTASCAPFQKNIIESFGFKVAHRDSDDRQTLERYLRPFVIERHPEETHSAVQDLMDPNSTSLIQLFLSYLALLCSNDLNMDDAIQAFFVKAQESDQLKYLKALFSQRSPSATAVVTRLLHAAIGINAINFLSKALLSGADIESPSTGSFSKTLLQTALLSKKLEVAQLLIDAGANVSVGASANISCQNPEVHVKSVICECKTGELQDSPIFLAAQSTTCTSLLPELMMRGAIIPECCPVLLYAISNKASVETVSYLISAGADINQCAILYFEEGATNALSAAVERGDFKIVQLLLDAGANPNGPLQTELKDFFESLSFWYRRKRFDKEGYDEHQPCLVLKSQSESPLFCALKQSYCSENAIYNIIRLLLDSGADPNISSLDLIRNECRSLDDELITKLYTLSSRNRLFLLYPLQAAVTLHNIEIVKVLLWHNACVNSLYGSPALTVAASQANIEMVRLLLSLNAEPNGISNHWYCQSPLEAAVETEDLDLIDLLLAAGADVNKHEASMLSPPAPIEGVSVLQGFVRNRLHEYVSRALETGADPNWASKSSSSPLAIAVEIADTVSLRLLLAAGADVHKYASLQIPDYVHEDCEDEDGEEDEYMYEGHKDYKLYRKRLSPIQWAAALNYVEVAKILCEAGANVNQPPCETDGDIALHLAVRRNNLEIMAFLIAQRVDVNAVNASDPGSTALNHAIENDLNRMIQWLLRYGADPNQPCFNDGPPDGSYSWCCPLEQACFRLNDHAVRSLLRAGADISQGCALLSVFCDYISHLSSDSKERLRRKIIMEVLLKYRADVNRRYYDTDTALQKAIMAEEFECAQRLIEAGANINSPASKGNGGRTALQAAASVGNVDLIEQLISKGADVNAPAAFINGVTSLQAAAIKGYLRIAQILLEHGADIDAKAGIENGRAAIDGAAEFGRIDMVKYLLDNYQGPKAISEICASAYKAAEKGKQWFVMDLLKNYEQMR